VNKYANEAETSVKLFQTIKVFYIRLCDGLNCDWLKSRCEYSEAVAMESLVSCINYTVRLQMRLNAAC